MSLSLATHPSKQPSIFLHTVSKPPGVCRRMSQHKWYSASAMILWYGPFSTVVLCRHVFLSGISWNNEAQKSLDKSCKVTITNGELECMLFQVLCHRNFCCNLASCQHGPSEREKKNSIHHPLPSLSSLKEDLQI